MKGGRRADSALARYWQIYGGMAAVLTSRYFWCAVMMTGILFPAWSRAGWWNDVLSLMPSLLGFSLGGFAMWIAIGDDGFKQVITGDDVNEYGEKEISPYMSVNATFVHFILLQILSIMVALLAKTYYPILAGNAFLYYWLGEPYIVLLKGASFLAFFFFVYSVFSALAAVLAIFRVSGWYNTFMTLRNHQENKK